MGEGEEGGLVGSAEPGDPNLAGGPVLPMKLRVCRSGICLLSLCNSSYSLCCPLWPPKVVPKEADIRDLLVLLAQAHPHTIWPSYFLA